MAEEVLSLSLCEPWLVIQAKKRLGGLGGGLQTHKLVTEQPEHPR